MMHCTGLLFSIRERNKNNRTEQKENSDDRHDGKMCMIKHSTENQSASRFKQAAERRLCCTDVANAGGKCAGG